MSRVASAAIKAKNALIKDSFGNSIPIWEWNNKKQVEQFRKNLSEDAPWITHMKTPLLGTKIQYQKTGKNNFFYTCNNFQDRVQSCF